MDSSRCQNPNPLQNPFPDQTPNPQRNPNRCRNPLQTPIPLRYPIPLPYPNRTPCQADRADPGPKFVRIVGARVQVTRKTRRRDPAKIAGLRMPPDVLLSRLPAVFPERIIDDLTQRYFDGMKDVVPYCVVALVAACVLCWPGLRGLAMRVRKPVRAVILIILAVLAIRWGWSLLWASDDAYISFRYAENLVRGHGLVFNPGERVEGYTDFLWTLIAAVAIACKADPGQVTILINLVSFGGLIFLVERLGTRLKSSPTLIGVATLCVAANYTLASFSTACIETMFAAMLVTLALERVDAGKPLAGGLAGIAATLTHPDHGIFYAVLALALLLDRERRRELAAYLIPFFVVFVPYFIWKRLYYGDWMPNTFYAKSAEKTYFEQGIIYLWTTIIGSGLWLTLPLAAVGALYARRTLIGRYAMLVLPIYLGYVAKVGGDFMLGRFFVPALPVWFLLVDAGYRNLLAKNHWRWAIALLIPATAAALPINVVKAGEIYHGIADERTFGGVDKFATMQVGSSGYSIGQNLYTRLTSRHVEPMIAVWGIGMLGYYSKLPLFDMRGLTSKSVAHLPIEQRGRPGHEKVASPGLVVESGAKLSELPVYPRPFADVTAVNFSGWGLFMVRYDAPLVSKLPPGSSPMSFPAYLDSQIPGIAHLSEADLACELWQLQEYYFATNDDPVRRSRVIAAAIQADPTLAGTERSLLTREPSPNGWQRVRGFTFASDEAAWSTAGDAQQWLTSSPRPDHEYPLGRKGRFVDTFVPPNGELSTGQLTSPPFVIEGDLMTFVVGGGKVGDSERLELVIDNQVVRKATGCNSEWMSRRVWNVAMFRGKTARLVITDASTGSWGHVTVNEIEAWKVSG